MQRCVSNVVHWVGCRAFAGLCCLRRGRTGHVERAADLGVEVVAKNEMRGYLQPLAKRELRAKLRARACQGRSQHQPLVRVVWQREAVLVQQLFGAFVAVGDEHLLARPGDATFAFAV